MLMTSLLLVFLFLFFSFFLIPLSSVLTQKGQNPPTLGNTLVLMRICHRISANPLAAVVRRVVAFLFYYSLLQFLA